MSTERNPWAKKSWNLTRQGAYQKEHGLEKARAAAREAGYDEEDFARLGLAEEKESPSLLVAFNRTNAGKFEQAVKDYKPASAPAWPNYSGYMARKAAKKLAGRS